LRQRLQSLLVARGRDNPVAVIDQVAANRLADAAARA